LLCLLLCCVCTTEATSVVKELSFGEIEGAQGDSLVLFYRASHTTASTYSQTLEKVAKQLSTKYPDFNYRKCNGDLPVNQQSFEKAGFGNEPFWFTKTEAAGIEKYIGPSDVTAIVEHIEHKYLPFNEADVWSFTNEKEFQAKQEASKFTFVKFYEDWCAHCQKLKATFNRAATFFKDQVDFVEVRCSSNDNTRAFCQKHKVSGYPVLILFEGDETFRYENERNIKSFGAFFKDHKAGSNESIAAAGDGDDNTQTPRKKEKKASKKPKKNSKNKKKEDEEEEEDDDEEDEDEDEEQENVKELKEIVAELRQTIAEQNKKNREIGEK